VTESDREFALDRLAELQRQTLSLLAGHDDTTCRRQHHPELSPLSWHVGHCAFVETHWLRERVRGEAVLGAPHHTLYLPENTPKTRRPAGLPPRADLAGWVETLQAENRRAWREVLADGAHPLLRDDYLLRFVIQHYCQHLETLRMLLRRLIPADAAPPARVPLSWRNLLSGLAFVRSRPVVLGAISMDLFAVLFGGATALLPAYAGDILHAGPLGLGFLRTASGIGAALCGLTLALHPIQRHVGRWMFGGVAVFGLATVVFGVSTSLWLSLAALTVLGAADMLSVYVRQMLVQLSTPDAIRGRVSAVNSVFIGASNEVGEFESGVTAAWWGVVPAVLVGGAATMLVAWAWTRLFPGLWRIYRFPGPEA